MPKLTGIYSTPSSSDEMASYQYANSSSTGLSSGSILMYVSDILPVGFLFCDGTAISRTSYANLFATIGTAYGSGDGTTTFNLPNMKGKMPIGVKSGGNVASLGATGGSFDHVHAMGQHTHAQSHTHTIAHTHTQAHTHTIDHSHTVGAHTHTCAHTHVIPRHYHSVSGSGTSSSHTHTLGTSNSTTAGTSRFRGSDNTGTAGSDNLSAGVFTVTSPAGTVGPNTAGDSDATSGPMVSQEGGIADGLTGNASSSNTGTYSGSTDSVSANTGASSVANSGAYASNTGNMATSPNVTSSNPAFLTVNFIIKT